MSRYTLPKLENQKDPVTIPPGTPVQISVRALHMYDLCILDKTIFISISSKTKY